MRLLFVALLAFWTQTALFAGCICPPMRRVDTGHLEVAKGVVTAQDWTLAVGKGEVTLSGTTADGKVEGSFWLYAGTSADFMEFEDYVRLNKTDKHDPALPEPKAKVVAGGGSVDLKTERIEETLRLAKKVKFTALGMGKTFKLKFNWDMPVAGQDGLNLQDPNTIARYCIDSTRKRELASTNADGFHELSFVLSEDGWEGKQGSVTLGLKKKNDKKVMSVCASGMKKRGSRYSLKLKTRDALIEPDNDKFRRIPVMFTAKS